MSITKAIIAMLVGFTGYFLILLGKPYGYFGGFIVGVYISLASLYISVRF